MYESELGHHQNHLFINEALLFSPHHHHCYKMLRSLICCSSSFQSDHELESCSGRKKVKKSNQCCKGKSSSGKSNNPFATSGLDKFSSLVADLREKRQRIYAQSADSDDQLVYVWFDFSSGSDTCKPVILKHKKNKQMEMKRTLFCDHKPLETEVVVNRPVENKIHENIDKGMKKLERRRSLRYLLGAVILTLILLLVFGRSVTIMWITVGWYLIPTTSNTTSITKKTTMQNHVPLHIQAMSPNRSATAK